MATHIAAGLIHVRGFGEHLESRFGAKDLLEPAAYDGVIVCDHDADRLSGISRLGCGGVAVPHCVKPIATGFAGLNFIEP
jgi:hypothetical protein